jgi:hypothetical protein
MQGIFQKENTDKALKYGIYRHLPTYEKIIRNLVSFWGKMRGGCLRNPEKDRRFLGKSLANLPEISGHLDFAGA